LQLRRAWPEADLYQAFDGFEAGSMLGVNRPQVVILDLNLPGVDGFELCRRIKQEPGFEQPWVVAITSSEEPGLEERLAALGADAFFRKPFDFVHLAESLQKRLSR
jgi:CheY-like chemotaxis protein